MGTRHRTTDKCNDQACEAQEQRRPGFDTTIKHPTQNDKLLGKKF